MTTVTAWSAARRPDSVFAQWNEETTQALKAKHAPLIKEIKKSKDNLLIEKAFQIVQSDCQTLIKMDELLRLEKMAYYSKTAKKISREIEMLALNPLSEAQDTTNARSYVASISPQTITCISGSSPISTTRQTLAATDVFSAIFGKKL